MKDAGEFMKEHAKEFQMDTDKIDVVRLALNATAIARNNSQSFAKMLFIKQKKMKPKINMSRVSIESPMFLEEEEEEEDFIPPSGGSEPSDIGKLTPGYPLAKPCLSDSNVPHGPLFAPLSEDSPVEMTGQPNVWDNGPVSLQLREPESLRPAIDTLGTIFEESEPSPSADAGYCRDLDYLEAAHYANDLVTTQNIVDGMNRSVIYPLDTYFKMVATRGRTFSDAFSARPQTQETELGPSLVVTASGDTVAADS